MSDCADDAMMPRQCCAVRWADRAGYCFLECSGRLYHHPRCRIRPIPVKLSRVIQSHDSPAKIAFPLERLVAALLFILYSVVMLRTAWISDDAAITFRVILNLSHGFAFSHSMRPFCRSGTRRCFSFLTTGGPATSTSSAANTGAGLPQPNGARPKSPPRCAR